MINVGIIGAGICGLLSAKQLRRHGIHHFLILEKTNSFGGIWQVKETNSPSFDQLKQHVPSCYASLRTNTPLEFISSNKSGEGSWRDINKICKQLYVDETLEDKIKFNEEVIKIRKKGNNWEVVTKKLDDTTTYFFTHVIVCSGGLPKIPPTFSLFTGFITHSAFYIHPKQRNFGSVLVVGNGPSGVEVAAELAQLYNVTLIAKDDPFILPAKFPYWKSWIIGWIFIISALFPKTPLKTTGFRSQRSKYAIFPSNSSERYYSSIEANKIIRETDIVAIDGNFIHFPSRKQYVDTIILATGFTPNIEFQTAVSSIDNLADRVFCPQDKTLAFLGYSRALSNIYLFDVQAAIIASAFSGKLEPGQQTASVVPNYFTERIKITFRERAANRGYCFAWLYLILSMLKYIFMFVIPDGR